MGAFVVGAENTSRQAARMAVEQLDAANAHLVGSVLNKVDLVRNPYYYSATTARITRGITFRQVTLARLRS